MSFSGDVAREDWPDRKCELSVKLPFDGEGDDFCPTVLPVCWNGFRVVVLFGRIFEL